MFVFNLEIRLCESVQFTSLGDDVNELLKNFKKGSVPRARVTSKPRLFNCDQCNWQTKFSSALKVHKTRIHSIQSQTQIKCDECTFQPIN